MSKAKCAQRVFALLPLKVNPIEPAINVYVQIYRLLVNAVTLRVNAKTLSHGSIFLYLQKEG